MIKIQRSQAPDFLLDSNGDWCKETARAIEHYVNNKKGAFKFSMYKDAKVKDELKKIFVKCAYCESAYGAVYDGDVEHFRPKGSVKEKKPSKPGYYWLANSWDNLFLACQHCNQRRIRKLYRERHKKGSGKLDQFPLMHEDARLKDHECDDILFKTEESSRLLIDPCKDDPSIHFSYKNAEGVISSHTSQGKASIDVYALQRKDLVKERKKHMLKLFGQIKCVTKELERLNGDINDQIQKKYFEEEFERLMEYADSHAIYAGMCRFFINRFLNDNGLL